MRKAAGNFTPNRWQTTWAVLAAMARDELPGRQGPSERR